MKRGRPYDTIDSGSDQTVPPAALICMHTSVCSNSEYSSGSRPPTFRSHDVSTRTAWNSASSVSCASGTGVVLGSLTLVEVGVPQGPAPVDFGDVRFATHLVEDRAAELDGDRRRRDHCGSRLGRAPLERLEPPGRHLHVVVEKHCVRRRDVLDRQVAGLVGREVSVDPEQREVVQLRQSLQLVLDTTRRTRVDDEQARAVLPVFAHVGDGRRCAGEGLSRHDDDGGRGRRRHRIAGEGRVHRWSLVHVMSPLKAME